MKIAFVTLPDPTDIRRGSGTYYHMSCELESQGCKVDYVGPVVGKVPLFTRLLKRITVKAGKRYITYLDILAAKANGKKASQLLSGLEHDILITNDYGIAADVKTEKPVIIYTDAMIGRSYPAGVSSYSRIANVPFFAAKFFQHTVKKALKRAALCVFPAQWIAEKALEYGIDSRKVLVIPFGANLKDPGRQIADSRTFARIIDKRRIDLLFVGKEWIRKGGDTALKTVQELRKRGIEAFLHIVGGAPTYSIDSSYTLAYGLLDKSISSDREKLCHLYRMSDVFIFPSSSEGFAIVPLEAAAYGLPVLAYGIEGVKGAVVNGESGILIAAGQSEVGFANAIEAWYINPFFYDRLIRGARKHYEEKVNWKISISTLLEKIQDYLNLQN